MDRYIIIIGAMKSGTTTLFSMLAAHPQIAPARNKEPGYYAFQDIYARGKVWYHSLFEFDPQQHIYRLEASTDYTKAPFASGVWNRMEAEENAEFKLIYIMRHPLRRIESHARHTQFTKKELGQKIMVRQDQSLDNGITMLNLVTSHYAKQLDGFKKPWKNGRLFLTTLEELEAFPEKVSLELTRFLEINPCLCFSSVPKKNSAADRSRLSSFWTSCSRIPILSENIKKILPHDIRDSLKLRFTRKISAPGRFQLTDDEEIALLSLLQDDLRQLRNAYGVDTRDFWGIG